MYSSSIYNPEAKRQGHFLRSDTSPPPFQETLIDQELHCPSNRGPTDTIGFLEIVLGGNELSLAPFSALDLLQNNLLELAIKREDTVVVKFLEIPAS